MDVGFSKKCVFGTTPDIGCLPVGSVAGNVSEFIEVPDGLEKRPSDGSSFTTSMIEGLEFGVRCISDSTPEVCGGVGWSPLDDNVSGFTEKPGGPQKWTPDGPGRLGTGGGGGGGELEPTTDIGSNGVAGCPAGCASCNHISAELARGSTWPDNPGLPGVFGGLLVYAFSDNLCEKSGFGGGA